MNWYLMHWNYQLHCIGGSCVIIVFDTIFKYDRHSVASFGKWSIISTFKKSFSMKTYQIHLQLNRRDWSSLNFATMLFEVLWLIFSILFKTLPILSLGGIKLNVHASMVRSLPCFAIFFTGIVTSSFPLKSLSPHYSYISFLHASVYAIYWTDLENGLGTH